MRKLSLATAMLTAVLIAALIIVPNVAFASPNFYGPLSGMHVPNIHDNISPLWPWLGWWFPYEVTSTYPYVGAYMDTGGDSSPTCTRVSVTVSFPNTPDPSVIGTGNWLAAGMFLQDQGGVGATDYGFYSVVVLDSYSNLWLDVGEWRDTEVSNIVNLGYISRTLDFAKTWLIQGVDRSTPITLTMYWDPAGSKTVYWSATINYVTYNPPGAYFNEVPVNPTIQSCFHIGNYNVNLGIASWWARFFQFGIMSPQPITKGGWQVQLLNPQYYQSSYWHTVPKATTVEGHSAWFDNTWQWGGKDYAGVSVSGQSIGTYRWAFFSYSGTTVGNGKILWQPMIV
jgi:hypothetical protein